MGKFLRKFGVKSIFCLLPLAFLAEGSIAMEVQKVELSFLNSMSVEQLIVVQVIEDLQLLQDHISDLIQEGLKGTEIFKGIEWDAVYGALEENDLSTALLALLTIRTTVTSIYIESKNVIEGDEELKNLFFDLYKTINVSVKKLMRIVKVESLTEKYNPALYEDLLCADSLLVDYMYGVEKSTFADAVNDFNKIKNVVTLKGKGFRQNIRQRLSARILELRKEVDKEKDKEALKLQRKIKNNQKKKQKQNIQKKFEKRKLLADKRRQKKKENSNSDNHVTKSVNVFNLPTNKDKQENNSDEAAVLNQQNINEEEQENLVAKLSIEDSFEAQEEENATLIVDNERDPFKKWEKKNFNDVQANNNNEPKFLDKKVLSANNTILESASNFYGGHYKKVDFDDVDKLVTTFGGKITQEQRGSHRTIWNEKGERIGGTYVPHSGRTYGPRVLKRILGYFEKANWTMNRLSRNK